MPRLDDTQVEHVKEIVSGVADSSVKEAFVAMLRKLEHIVDSMACGLQKRIDSQEIRFARFEAIQANTDKTLERLTQYLGDLAKVAESNEKAIANLVTQWKTAEEIRLKRNDRIMLRTAIITCAIGVLAFVASQVTELKPEASKNSSNPTHAVAPDSRVEVVSDKDKNKK